jgi:hypothetical protein
MSDGTIEECRPSLINNSKPQRYAEMWESLFIYGLNLVNASCNYMLLIVISSLEKKFRKIATVGRFFELT